MYITPSSRLSAVFGLIPGLGISAQKIKLQNPVVHDFVAMLYLFYLITYSDKHKQHTFEDLKSLLETRVAINKSFFVNNTHILTTYEFVSKIVDFFHKQSK